MSGELEKLKQYHNELRLAEVAAWLHDMGKCTDEFIQQEETRGFKSKKSKSKRPGWLNPHKAVFAPSELSQFAFSEERYPEREEEAESSLALHRLLGKSILSALDQTITLFGQQYTLRELIYFGRPGMVGKTGDALKKEGLPADYLGRSHGAAHMEKEEGEEQKGESLSDAWRNTAFGTETRVEPGLTEMLKGLPFSSPTDRVSFEKRVSTAFAKALGDTRRPENEVTLWDWSITVAALYKAALAGALLGHKPEPNDLHWRLLSVRVDGMAFLENVTRLPDLLARQKLLKDAFERVRTVLEEIYALGTEIYRDGNSSIYIVPNLSNLLIMTNDQSATLEQIIHDEFARGTVKSAEQLAIRGEVVPIIELDAQPWQAQRPDRTFDVPPVGKLVKKPLLSHSEPAQVQQWWQGKNDEVLCPVCCLRPRPESDEVCNVCEQRRGSRVEWWEKNPDQTIWLDEIADHNGRVALIVGKFGLGDWLSGDLVQTMLVKADNDPAKCVPKNPSPARLRRVWETCRGFWTEAVGGILNELPKHQRWTLSVGELPKDMPEGAVCDGTLNGQAISVWRQGHHLLTISYVQAEPVGELNALWEKDGRKFSVAQRIQQAKAAEGKFAHYRPSLTLLESPDQFLDLVPAADALTIAKSICKEYEKQFGKVRNRLPLFLGLVFFPRKTPLTAVMEAARRMLNGVKLSEAKWKVSRRTHDTLQFDNGVEWLVPTKMGDGTTADDWYPYFFVADGVDVSDRRRRFQLKKEGTQDAHKIGEVGDKFANRYLVHVEDLRPGDRVYLIPSRFDFEWLDTTGQRFEIFYDQDGCRRTPAKRNRPYLLEDLKRFQTLWDQLAGPEGLSTAQIKALDGLIEAKREAWQQPTGPERTRYDQTFKDLVCNALVNAGWKRDKKSNAEKLYRAALTGRLHDLLELYMEILKEKPGSEQQSDSKGDVHDQR